MIEYVTEALYNTPWWVYVLFIYLFMIGIRATKTNVVSIKKLFIIPVIFTVLSIHTLLTTVEPVIINGITWAVSMGLGGFVGWMLVNRFKFKVDRPHWLIKVPGNWTTFILIMIIFVSKYAFGYAIGDDPTITQSVPFDILLLIVSGLCTGTFVGRALCYLSKFYTQSSENLEDQVII